MAEYRVTEVDVHNVREWDGPNGKVYYVPVMLEGHKKWVSIGKKEKDAIKIGDVVNGTIEETDYNTDKFKAEKMFQQRYDGPKRNTPETEAKRSDGMRQGMCFNNAANYVNAQLVNGHPLSAKDWADSVFDYAQALYAKGDLKEAEQSAIEALAQS